MFDTYVARRGRTEYVTREVHEHRAPTDKSVKLLREMEEAARKNVIASIPLDGNFLHGAVRVEHHPADDVLVLTAVIDLNGSRLTVDVRRHAMTVRGNEEKVKLLTELRDAVATKIADSVLSRALDKVRW